MTNFFWERVKKVLVVSSMVAAFGFFSHTTVSAVFYSPEEAMVEPDITTITDVAAKNTVTELSNENGQRLIGTPTRLIIPTLNIDASVQHVGVNGKGNMSAPDNFTDVGWYKYGPRPGENGSAVIDGHVDNGLGLPGVFKNLKDLKEGDEIGVVDLHGKIVSFVVTGIKTYPYLEVPNEMVFFRNGTAKLNLITCGGVFLPDQKTYDERLVIFAELLPLD